MRLLEKLLILDCWRMQWPTKWAASSSDKAEIYGMTFVGALFRA